MTTVQGHCDPRFSALRDIFSQHLSSGNELGASICVSINGTPVIDLWGGHANPARTQPWGKDTIAPVWSISKTISALAVLLLIDRGLLHPDDPVAKHWPAFNTPDKRGVLVRHCLSHSSALPSWDPPISAEELFDTPLATEKLISQKPWWEPGTASGYHLISQGLLLGGIVERVSGKSLPEFIRDELALPRTADFHLGIQDETEWARIAEMVVPPPISPADSLKSAGGGGGASIAMRAMMGCPLKAEYTLTPEFRRSGIGSIGGFSNARGFNRILNILTLGGEVDGKRFLDRATVDLIFQTQSEGRDLVLGSRLKIGMGFGLVNGSLDWMPASGKVCFWGGWGGSMAVMDLDRKVTFTYAMNRMENGTLGNQRAQDYFKAVYAVLEAEAGAEGRASL
ncbi:beta-lactamase/transpeptidase-like protein [Aspergillus cavernicola]|uniref:Beta-lactamase/transpeptidase-like protein n=1 Tax=Aspergillus cavernicola TaxID=176166 RepID=A0ABR4I7X3_9EURO